MTNDNRKMIVAHQLIDDASNNAYYQQQMGQHREMILAQEKNIRMLNAELADITAQRDAWRKTACASAIAPERLKTVEPPPEIHKCEICGGTTDNPLCVKCAGGLRYLMSLYGTPTHVCICCERTFTSGFWWSDLSEDVIVCEKCHETSLKENEGE